MQRRTLDGSAPPRGNCACAAATVAACVVSWTGAAAADPTLGSAAPDFVLAAMDGRNLRLSEYRGEPVVLAFWGSWCGPCRESLATLADVAARTGTPALGVNLDGSTDRAAPVVDALRLDFPTLLDTRQSVARAYDVQRLPLTLLLDRDGAVRAAWSGTPVDATEMSRRIDSLRQE